MKKKNRRVETANNNRMAGRIAALQKFEDHYIQRIQTERTAIVNNP